MFRRGLAEDGRMAAALTAALAVLLAMTVVSCQKDSGSEAVGPIVDSVASADGVMIHYEVHGSGEHPLVFVHCWSCDRSYWDAQVKDFSPDYKVVTLDLAGHGESGMGREVWSMEAYGADVAAVVNDLRLNDIILVGHSMGGAVTIEAARQLGDKVTAVIGVDTFQDLTGKMPEEQVKQFVAPFRDNFPVTTEMFIRRMFPPDADTALVDRVAKDLASAPPEVAIGSFEQLFAFDAPAALTDVKAPLRAINTDRYPTNVEGNKQVASSFEVVYMPGYGHFLYLEDSGAFDQILRQTIAEFWPPEAGQ
jgi:pimeloyl-ACP methyl ester carboxylesterase